MNYSVDQDPNRSLTLVLYILYILAIFTVGLLAIVALIVNYIKRDAVKGSIFESHFTWQIRTFWWYLVWNVVACLPFILLFFTANDPNVFAGVAVSGLVFFVLVAFVAWVWIVYRAIRGLIALNDNQPMYQ